MLGNTKINTFTRLFSTYAGSVVLTGISVTPGYDGSEGSWLRIITSTNVTQDVWCVVLNVMNSFTSATSRNILLDIGIDESGGTNFTPIVSNLQVGQAGTQTQGSYYFQLPIWIPKNSSIGVRAQTNKSTGTLQVRFDLWGNPSEPSVVRTATYSETIGNILESSGTTLSNNNTWYQMGVTSKPLWYWLPSVNPDNTTSGATTGYTTLLDFAFGTSTHKTIFLRNIRYGGVSVDEQFYLPQIPEALRAWYVPAGSTIYARRKLTDSASALANLTVLLTGLGG